MQIQRSIFIILFIGGLLPSGSGRVHVERDYLIGRHVASDRLLHHHSRRLDDDTPTDATPTSAFKQTGLRSTTPHHALPFQGRNLQSPQCGVQDFQRECSFTGQCKEMYADATDCKNSEGGVCFCGDDDEVCGCSTVNDAPPPPPTSTSTVPTPVPPSCDVQEFRGECSFTGQCRDMYPTALDCKRSEGGICFCENDVACGCSTGIATPPPPTPLVPTPVPQSSCGVQDFQGECSYTGQCRDMYPNAFDCKRSEGGVCFCGDDEVCGCAGSTSPPTEDFCLNYPKVLDRREWPAGDLFFDEDYLKTYQLRGLGEHIEIWVADDIAFPDPNDCRNILKTTDVTDEQVASFIEEFDNVIYPAVTSKFFVPPPRNGTFPQIEDTFAANATECTFRGEGARIVTLVDNIKDERYWEPLNGEPMSYTAGFYFGYYDFITDRSIMTINAFDWLHRSGSNPPDDTETPEYQACATELGRNNAFSPSPFLYERVFAHEFGHLLEEFVDGFKDTWLSEMMAEYAAFLVGYDDENLALDPDDPDFFNEMALFLGFADDDVFGGPEQSITSWSDQGDIEILADYSAVLGFGYYLSGRFGVSFIGEFAAVPNADNLDGLQEFLLSKGEEVSVQELIQDWLVASAVSAEIDGGATLSSNSRSEADLFMPIVPRSRINWDTHQAYSSSGAPNNGADFVRVRDTDDTYFRADEIDLVEFSGSLQYENDPLEWIQEDSAIFSGDGNDLNRAMVREISIPPTISILSLDLSWEIEFDYDYLFVQLRDEDGTWVDLASENTTALGPMNFALTGSSGGEILSQSFDVTSFAGKTTYLALRYVTDFVYTEEGARLHGMSFEDVDGLASAVEDGADLDAWESETEVFPIDVDEWVVTLVAYTPGGSVVYANDISLDSNKTAVLEAPELATMIGSSAEVVAAIVSVGASIDKPQKYPSYELKVNGVVQPGGS